MFFSIRKKSRLLLKIDEKYKHECIKISLAYLIIGFLWIYFSDKIAHKLTNNKDMFLIISTYKGWVYVVVTSITLYLLISRLLRKVNLSEMKFNEVNEELTASNEELGAYIQELTASEEELRAQYDQITENEQKLRKSEERYRNLVNEMQQGLALYEGSFDGEDIRNYRLLDVNESYERLTKMKSKDILGKTVCQCLPSLEKEIIEKLNIVVKTGQSYNYQHYLKDTKRFYEIVAYRPKKLQLAVIVNDITERKKVEQDLITSEYNFRNIFESSSDAILILEDDLFTNCNLAALELLGVHSKESILGKGPEMFSPEKQPDGQLTKAKAAEMYRRAMEEGKCKFEWWHKKEDGSLLPVEIMMTTIVLNGKKVLHSLLRDISERKQMEDRLQYLSYHDQLTGLYNRRFFEEELIRLDVESSFPLSIVMADVNGLKLVNALLDMQ